MTEESEEINTNKNQSMVNSTTSPTERGEIQDHTMTTKGNRITVDLIEWRRAKVVELLGMGKTQRQIAELLRVHESTISLDVKYLRREAKEKMGEYLENLPFRHKVRMAAMDKTIAELWNLYDKETDNRLKKGILDSIKDAVLAQAQLDGDPMAIDRALKAVAKIRKQKEEVEGGEQEVAQAA